jgi:plastocyanin
MQKPGLGKWLLAAIVLVSGAASAQESAAANSTGELRLRIVSSMPGTHQVVPAVIWLEPRAGTPALPFTPHDHYVLLQKNRMFAPHMQVIPVGATVQFPNADPFFHNVFSLYDGKRFDLGLYEAGTSKSVTFSHAGVSYICNIHPDMSAVVLALTTPLYAIADGNDSFVLPNIPPGDYTLRVWIESISQPILEGLTRQVHVPAMPLDLGELKAPIPRGRTMPHDNKFGQAYAPDPQSAYPN